MTVTTEDQVISRRDGIERGGPVGDGETLYTAQLLAWDGDGYIVNGVDGLGFKFAGISNEHVDNSAGSDGDLSIERYVAGDFLLETVSTLTVADIGKRVYMYDNMTVGLAAEVNNELFVGVIVEVNSEGVWVAIHPDMDVIEGLADAHLDGGTSKHDATEIDVEGALTHFPAGGLQAALAAADAKVPTADEKAGLAAPTPAAANPVVVKNSFFASTEQTGDGSEQSIAHGLAGTPTQVIVVPTDYATGTSFDIDEGTHDATNVKVTVTNTVKYKVLAIYGG